MPTSINLLPFTASVYRGFHLEFVSYYVPWSQSLLLELFKIYHHKTHDFVPEKKNHTFWAGQSCMK